MHRSKLTEVTGRRSLIIAPDRQLPIQNDTMKVMRPHGMDGMAWQRPIFAMVRAQSKPVFPIVGVESDDVNRMVNITSGELL
jgi:hypothetical protein